MSSSNKNRQDNFVNKGYRFNIRSNFLAVLIICILGIVIYSNTFQSPFVFDDQPGIVDNKVLRNLSDLNAIWSFNPTHFIVYITLALNYYYHQLNVFGYHLVNLLIHCCAALMVWWLVSLTFRTPAMKDKAISKQANLIAFFSGLLFISHPVQTEAVTYIVQRSTSLAAFFYITSLALYVKSRLSLDNTPVAKGYYVLSLITAVLGMFSKQIVITLPFMVILYEFCFFQRSGKRFGTSLPDSSWSSVRDLPWKRLALFLILLLIIPLNMAISKNMDFWQISQLTKESEVISRGTYILTQFRVLTTYLKLFFMPLNQNLDYDYPLSSSLWQIPVLSSFLFLMFILITAIVLFNRYRLIAFSIFWFFLTLSVESSFIPIRDVIFEHRLYLPMVGYSLFLPLIVYYFFQHRNIRLGIIILIMIISFYAFLTYARNNVWKSDVTLWSDAISKSPKKLRPYTGRARAYQERGYYDEALADYNRALIINPFNMKCYNNRGMVYLKKGEYDKAIADYTHTLKTNPDDPGAYNNRGLAYLYKGKYQEAVSDFSQALKFKPGYVNAYCNRAAAYCRTKEYNKAWADVKRVEKLGGRINPEIMEDLMNWKKHGQY